MSELLTVTTIGEDPLDYLRQQGTVVAEFGHRTQDSGNVSWLVDVANRRLFVKTAGVDSPPAPGAPGPYFDHQGRVRLLRNAIDLAHSCHHPALARLLNVIESPAVPALVYEAAEGELVRVSRGNRDDPASAYQRFAHLPADQLLGVFDVLIDLHVALAAAGWIAGDLYDGCLIVDFATASLTVIDIDSYRRSPSANDMGRMFGATRFMAPEESSSSGRSSTSAPPSSRSAGSRGHFGTRLNERAEDFCGLPVVAQVVQRACQASPALRHLSVASFAEAWRTARDLPGKALLTS